MIRPNTHSGRLLLHFEQGKSIDRLMAIVDLGIHELSSRIIDLENHGFKINKRPKKVTNRYGKRVDIVEYSLARQEVVA